MKIGLPRGLYYFKFDNFLEKFLDGLGLEVVSTPDTNKTILLFGVDACVDDACLPIKLYHGHVQYLRDKCDLIIVPRIMEMGKKEYICPKFCGLPDMLKHSIPGLPPVTEMPFCMYDPKKQLKWCEHVGRLAGVSGAKVQRAFSSAYETFQKTPRGMDDSGRTYKIGLLGHAYNVYDPFANMDVVKKLNGLGAGVVTEERIPEACKKEIYKSLLIYPFWSSVKETVGAGRWLARSGGVDGIVYLSSFQCGIDSVNVDLLKDFIGDFPLLVLKLDEHSGEAGMDTRIEAFMDMIERRRANGHYIPSYGQYLYGG